MSDVTKREKRDTTRSRFFRILRKWLEKDSTSQTTAKDDALFLVFLDHLLVGQLCADRGHWKFCYSEEAREKKIRPITDFPDLRREYTSEELWPFFSIRIPSMKQQSVKAILRREGIDQDDDVQLLRRFGQRTIANPYVLKEEPEHENKCCSTRQL